MEKKIALLNINDAELAKLPKFMASLTFVTADEMSAILDFLKSKGVVITLAHELTIFANALEDIKRKFSILEEVHAIDIYIQNPIMINKNAIEIYKKINYCIQNSVPYKKEDGTYEPFLFSESEWQKKFNKDAELIASAEPNRALGESVVTLEPVITSEQVVIPFEPVSQVSEEPRKAPQDDRYMDIQEFMSSPEEIQPTTLNFASLKDSVSKMHTELNGISAQASSLASERKKLENQYANLSLYKDSLAQELADDFVGFDEIEPDYRTRRAA
ncbi:MAG: hypothetical protein E7161_00195 [Firmicutes bacterium]|nr:hypothetical protein [Bacillota bacterium]